MSTLDVRTSMLKPPYMRQATVSYLLWLRPQARDSPSDAFMCQL